MKVDDTAIEILTKCMGLVAERVKKKVLIKSPGKFAIALNGSSSH